VPATPVPILSHLDPVHDPTTHFLQIRLNIIIPLTPGCSKWSLSLRFPHQNPVYASPLHLSNSEFRADRPCYLENRKASGRGWLLSVGSDCAVLVPLKLCQFEGVIIRVILSGTVSDFGAETSNRA